MFRRNDFRPKILGEGEKDNYKNRRDYDPSKWGPKEWFSLEVEALGYPDNPEPEHINAMRNRIEGLRYILPCGSCRGNFAGYLAKRGLTDNDLSSKYNLLKYIVDLHNHVGNKGMTVESLVKYYDDVFSDNCHYMTILIIIVSFIVICVICYYCYKYGKYGYIIDSKYI